MRTQPFAIAALLLAACTPATTQNDRPASEAEAELRAANAEYDKALVAGDAASLDRLMTEDFSIIDDDAGIHDKRNQIDFMTKKVDLLNARGDDVRVTMLGPDAALVTGRFTGRYRMAGKEADFAERYTSVWVRRAQGWNVRHEHASLVPPPEVAQPD